MNAKRKILVSIILSMIIVVGMKLVLPNPSKNTELIKQFWTIKTHSKDKFDIVIGGDSRVYRGISPKDLLAYEADKTIAINLGYSSAGFSKQYIEFLESRLSSDEGMLVLGITPHSLTKEAAKNEAFNEKYNISLFERYRGLYLSEYLKHFAPYKASDILPISGNENYVQEFNLNGWVASYKIKEDTSEAIASYRKNFQEYSVDETIYQEFLSELERLKEKGIDIYAFRPPTTIEMKNLEDSLSGFDEQRVKNDLHSIGIMFIEVDDSRYHSYDGSHLHFESAVKFSEFLAQVIWI